MTEPNQVIAYNNLRAMGWEFSYLAIGGWVMRKNISSISDHPRYLYRIVYQSGEWREMEPRCIQIDQEDDHLKYDGGQP